MGTRKGMLMMSFVQQQYQNPVGLPGKLVKKWEFLLVITYFLLYFPKVEENERLVVSKGFCAQCRKRIYGDGYKKRESTEQ